MRLVGIERPDGEFVIGTCASGCGRYPICVDEDRDDMVGQGSV